MRLEESSWGRPPTYPGDRLNAIEDDGAVPSIRAKAGEENGLH